MQARQCAFDGSRKVFFKFTDMKSLKIRNLLFFISGLVGLILLSCQQDNSQTKVTREALSYVSNYTHGPLQSESSILIRFYKDLPQHFKSGQELDEVLEISPSIAGKCVVSGSKGIEFVPDKGFAHGEMYHFHLHLNKLFAEAKSDFQFSVKIVPLNFTLHSSGITPEKRTDSPAYRYDAKLVFTDAVDMERAKDIVRVEYLGEKTEISFLPAENQYELPFRVSGIVRGEEDAYLHIHLDGSILSIDNQNDIEVKIPGKNSFEILNVRPVSENTQYIEVQFSEILKKKQDLTGLIKIEDNKTEKFLIQENLIKVFPAELLNEEVTVKIYSGIQSNTGK